MSWFSSWIKALRSKAITNAIKSILGVFLGKLAEQGKNDVIEAVRLAEATQASGKDKFKIAYESLEDKYAHKVGWTERLAKAAIELAVELVDPKGL